MLGGLDLGLSLPMFRHCLKSGVFCFLQVTGDNPIHILIIILHFVAMADVFAPAMEGYILQELKRQGKQFWATWGRGRSMRETGGALYEKIIQTCTSASKQHLRYVFEQCNMVKALKCPFAHYPPFMVKNYFLNGTFEDECQFRSNLAQNQVEF